MSTEWQSGGSVSDPDWCEIRISHIGFRLQSHWHLEGSLFPQAGGLQRKFWIQETGRKRFLQVWCVVCCPKHGRSLCHYAILMIHPIGFIGSMYGIFTYIWLTCMAHVGKYATHGSYWYVKYNSDSMNLELSLVLMLCPGCKLLSFPSCPAQPGPSGSAPFMESARRRTHYHLSTSPTTAFNMLKIYHRRRRSSSLSITALWILHLESLQRRTVWVLRREWFLIGCTFLSWKHHMLQKDPESISASNSILFLLDTPGPFFRKCLTHICAESILRHRIHQETGLLILTWWERVPDAAFANQILCVFSCKAVDNKMDLDLRFSRLANFDESSELLKLFKRGKLHFTEGLAWSNLEKGSEGLGSNFFSSKLEWDRSSETHAVCIVLLRYLSQRDGRRW